MKNESGSVIKYNCSLEFSQMMASLDLSEQEPMPYTPSFVKTYQAVQQQLDVH